jgi:XisH protein
MPARDAYHDAVKHALEKDGWHITHDPYVISFGKRDVFIDLGAEVIAAEYEGKRIAVEVKSFIGKSEVTELEKALGQFILYRNMLEQNEPERVLYLAVPEAVMVSLFEDTLGELLILKEALRLVSFDPTKEEVKKWRPNPR